MCKQNVSDFNLTTAMQSCRAQILVGNFNVGTQQVAPILEWYATNFPVSRHADRQRDDLSLLCDWIASSEIHERLPPEQALVWAERGRAHVLDAGWRTAPAMMASTLDVLNMRQAIPVNGAVVYVLITPWGTDALIIRQRGEIDILNLPLTIAQVDEWFFGHGSEPGYTQIYAEHLRDWHKNYSDAKDKIFRAAFTDMLDKIWHNLMEPIHHGLLGRNMGEDSQIVMVLPGIFNTIPVASAGPRLDQPDGGNPFNAQFNVSRVASLAKLAEQKTRRNCCEDQAARILAVLDPESYNQTPLSGALAEGAAIRAHAAPDTYTVLEQKDATKQTFLDEAPKFSMLHLSQHSDLNLDIPELSRLFFERDEVLTLRELSNGPALRGAHIYMPTCNGGSSADHAGSFSFPTSFSALGAASVTAAHVPILDATSPVLTWFFYHYRLDHKGHVRCRAAEALRRASRRVRHVTIGELMDIFEQARDSRGELVPYSIDCSRPRGVKPATHSATSRSGSNGADFGSYRAPRPANSEPQGPVDTPELDVEEFDRRHKALARYMAVRRASPGAILFTPPEDEGLAHRPFFHPIHWATFSVFGV